jgi:hypothetical protein
MTRDRRCANPKKDWRKIGANRRILVCADDANPPKGKGLAQRACANSLSPSAHDWRRVRFLPLLLSCARKGQR